MPLKNLALLSAFLCILYSCPKETAPLPDLVPQGTGKLFSTYTQEPDAERSGLHLVFQETYKFDEDGTFLKERKQAGNSIRAEGTGRTVTAQCWYI